jgi:endonuclease/exonuclease/phosphatase family metal-dependent hydrolase
MKLSRIASVIKSYKGGADILFFQEVENMDVLKILRDNHLQGLGYKTIVLIEGDDFRGIDVAVMSKLPLAERPVLHKIPFSKKKSTRGILQTTFHLPDKKKLYTLTLHFPSQASPVKFRMEAFRYLNDIKKKLPGNAMVIAAGDCNVTSDEDREYQIFDKVIQDNWLVSHRIGKMKYKGSTYFSRTESWSFFDIILFSKSLFSKTKGTWSVIPESIRISNSDNRQISSEDTPLRFKYPNFDGVSDHWPVVAEINLNQ